MAETRRCCTLWLARITNLCLRVYYDKEPVKPPGCNYWPGNRWTVDYFEVDNCASRRYGFPAVKEGDEPRRLVLFEMPEESQEAPDTTWKTALAQGRREGRADAVGAMAKVLKRYDP